jgi:hypothetical protein
MREFVVGTVRAEFEKYLGNGVVEDEIAVEESTCMSEKKRDREKKRRLTQLFSESCTAWGPSEEYGRSGHLTRTFRWQSGSSRPFRLAGSVYAAGLEKRDCPGHWSWSLVASWSGHMVHGDSRSREPTLVCHFCWGRKIACREGSIGKSCK